jgi:hypothetical protein
MQETRAMKKLKQKVASRREFVRMVTVAAPAILIAGTAAAYDPTEEIPTGIGTPRKKAPPKKGPRKKRSRATRR